MRRTPLLMISSLGLACLSTVARGAPPQEAKGAPRAPQGGLTQPVGAQAVGAQAVGAQATEAKGADPVGQFSGERAFEVLARYVELGGRHYGAATRPQVIKRMRDELAQGGGASGLVPVQSAVDHFKVVERASDTRYELANIVVRLHPERAQRVLIGSHWDTRLWAEEDQDPTRHNEPITGANDGTSGLAVLFELSRLAQVAPLSRLGLDLVLFDGEEFGRPKSDDYCQGSRRFASQLSRWYPDGGRPLAVLILDMVGDRELSLPPERSSLVRARSLTQVVYGVARDQGASAFTLKKLGPWIVDDHTPFQELGIPAMLLIDYEYPQWHTHQDTLERCSSESLEQVGRVVWETLKQLDTQLGQPAPQSPTPTRGVP